jgi:molecular chaperone GrpE
MSDPNSPEAMKPGTPQTEGPDTAASGGGNPAEEAAQAAGGDTQPQKPQAYVDPEIAAEARLMEWEAEKADLSDKLMRVHAEMDNLRKRTEREKADISKYAITKFAGDMLAVADNLERALAAMPETEEVEAHTKALVQGVELTSQDLRKALERHNVVRIEALSALFDPNFHQAVMEEENKDVAAGTITRVLQEGYRIGDRVLRPSMVVVARGGFKPMKPANDTSAAPEAQGAANPAGEGSEGQPGAAADSSDAPKS